MYLFLVNWIFKQKNKSSFICKKQCPKYYFLVRRNDSVLIVTDPPGGEGLDDGPTILIRRKHIVKKLKLKQMLWDTDTDTQTWKQPGLQYFRNGTSKPFTRLGPLKP